MSSALHSVVLYVHEGFAKGLSCGKSSNAVGATDMLPAERKKCVCVVQSEATLKNANP